MRYRLGGLVLPFLASLALVSVVAMSVVVGFSAIADRDRLAKQSGDLRLLVEAEQADQATREQRVDEALDRAADLLYEVLADHDRRTGESHEQLYQRISALLARPAGVAQDPVAATIPRAPAGGSTVTRPPRRSATTTTTTTTTSTPPGCAKQRAKKKC